MYLNKQQNPLGIVPGDIVEIHFDHVGGKGPFSATVTKVTDRTDMGYGAHIDYEDAGGGWDEILNIPKGCSVSHVTKVISRFPRHRLPVERKRNIFADQLEAGRAEGRYLGYEKVRRGIYRGDLRSLALTALGSAKDGLDRPLCEQCLNRMWESSRHPGLIKGLSKEDSLFFIDDRITIRWKVFKRWILQNRHRLMMSVKEHTRMAIAIKANEAMWEGVEEDIMDSWDSFIDEQTKDFERGRF